MISTINDCVHRFWRPGDCETTLNLVQNKISETDFTAELIQTLAAIVAAGRRAEGANPPASFQVYVAGYVQFWNDDDLGCDSIYWNVWPLDAPLLYLTTQRRQQMNNLVDQLNAVIEAVATAMNGLGVFYVDHTTFQPAFDKHRFCEPANQDYLQEPTGSKTYFWHYAGPGWGSGSEGDESPTFGYERDHYYPGTPPSTRSRPSDSSNYQREQSAMERG